MEKIVKKCKMCYTNAEKGGICMDLIMNCYSSIQCNEEKKSNIFMAYKEYRSLKKCINKMQFDKYISMNKDIMNGKPVIFGTRITSGTIFEYFMTLIHEKNEIKNPLKKIVKEYDITEDQAIYAIAYEIKNKNFFATFSR